MGNDVIRSNVFIQIGPFSVGVSVSSAVASEARDTGLKTLCQGHEPLYKTHAPTAIKRTDACPTCENSTKATFVKGRVAGGGTFTVVPQDVLDATGVDEQTKNVMAITTHPAGQLEQALPGGSVYYLSPTPGSDPSYALIRALLEKRTDLRFVTMWAAKTAAAMYELAVYNSALVLKKLAWIEDVKDAPVVDVPIVDGFLDQMSTFADMLAADFDPAQYKSRRREVLSKFLETAEPVAGADAPAAIGGDLGDKLAAAIAAAKAERGAEDVPLQPVPDTLPEGVAPIKKPRARKTAAAGAPKRAPRKTAASKTA